MANDSSRVAPEAEEPTTGKNILFPIRIDDAVMETEKDWAQRIRKTRHIGDFQKWKDAGAYQKAFDQLLQDLRGGVILINYKKRQKLKSANTLYQRL